MTDFLFSDLLQYNYLLIIVQSENKDPPTTTGLSGVLTLTYSMFEAEWLLLLSKLNYKIFPRVLLSSHDPPPEARW